MRLTLQAWQASKIASSLKQRYQAGDPRAKARSRRNILWPAQGFLKMRENLY